MFSCQNHKNQEKVPIPTNKGTNNDTVFYYWKPDYSVYSFDTVVNETGLEMKTFCLNDSSIYVAISSKNHNEPIQVKVAHNFKTILLIKTRTKELKFSLGKENFRSSLPKDFYKICYMWKNEFSHIENDQFIFQAVFAEPDTDYQYSIVYSINENGEMVILKVEDDSY